MTFFPLILETFAFQYFFLSLSLSIQRKKKKTLWKKDGDKNCGRQTHGEKKGTVRRVEARRRDPSLSLPAGSRPRPVFTTILLCCAVLCCAAIWIWALAQRQRYATARGRRVFGLLVLWSLLRLLCSHKTRPADVSARVLRGLWMATAVACRLLDHATLTLIRRGGRGTRTHGWVQASPSIADGTACSASYPRQAGSWIRSR